MFIVTLKNLLSQHGLQPELALVIAVSIGLFSIFFISWVSFYLARHYVLRLVRYLASHLSQQWSDQLTKRRVFLPLSYFVPLLVIYYMAPLIATKAVPFSDSFVSLLTSLTVMLMLLVATVTINNFLNAVGDIYQRLKIARHRPIKSYLQVAKIILYGLSAISIISALLNQSPLTLLTGLGALTAILLLVFKDSILGFVASVQIASYDMVRINDWITIPKYGVDGDVMDISLNTIKVQNFDKTIVTIPTHSILNEGVKNWRGMQESGGRRIKRAIHINMHSIRFCTQEMLQRFSKIQYVTEHIDNKLKEIHKHNATLSSDLSLLVNGRHLTNIGVFRAYLENYLNNPRIFISSSLLFSFVSWRQQKKACQLRSIFLLMILIGYAMKRYKPIFLIIS